MDSITRHQGSTYQEPFIDPMDDLDDEGFESQDIALTERASLISNGLKSSSGVETPPKKVAIIWLKARGENDPALSSEERNKDRAMNMEVLGRIGYDVRFVSSGREYFDTLHQIKERGETVSEVTFSQHGSPTSCGDFKVRDGKIISVDPTLTPEEQANPFGPLNEVLDEDAVVVFNSCSTGNKSVEDNIGKVASETLTRSKVFAPQHKIIYDPMYMVEEDFKRGGAVVSSVQFMYINSEEDDRFDPHQPPVYVGGKETTGQAPIPYAVRSNGGWGVSSLVNSVAAGARNFFSGIGGYFSPAQSQS
ncbi:MAG: hypothetical protein KFB93_00110 [Simkaniaceae bacterium]|nr:MAG: hypothetical protein KFB93_00110 [Simkaniaceae bacterium]